MLFINQIPSPPLDKYISGIVYYSGYITDFERERFLPDCTTNLVIDLKDKPKFIYDNDTNEKIQRCESAWFSGMHTKYLTISSGDDSEMMVITFKPGFCYPFIGEALINHLNTVVPAEDVFGTSILSLRNELRTVSQSEKKIELAENWLNSIRSEASFSEEVIQTLVAEIREASGLVDLNSIAKRSGYSQKQFIHLFKKYIGLTPKQFHRIVRFNEILNAIHTKSDVDWIRIAVGCGYYDQAHFIKDFHEFSGLNPAKYLTDQGEWAHYIPQR